MLNAKFEANWQMIKQNKQRRVHYSNVRENNKRIPHQYKVGNKVLYQVLTKSKFRENPYLGPYIVQQVNGNGTGHLSMGAITGGSQHNINKTIQRINDQKKIASPCHCCSYCCNCSSSSLANNFIVIIAVAATTLLLEVFYVVAKSLHAVVRFLLL